MCAKLCASPLWSAPDPCDDPSKHRAKDGKHDQWDGPSHHRGDQWRRAGTQIPEQRPHSFALQTPDGQKEQRRHKQSRQKSGDSDSLWSGHAQLIAIGQAAGQRLQPVFCIVCQASMALCRSMCRRVIGSGWIWRNVSCMSCRWLHCAWTVQSFIGLEVTELLLLARIPLYSHPKSPSQPFLAPHVKAAIDLIQDHGAQLV